MLSSTAGAQKQKMKQRSNAGKIRCRVRGCPNLRGSDEFNKDNGISFHRFPKNPHSRDKWYNFCDNPDISDLVKDTEREHRLVVCCWHFDSKDVIGDGRSRLVFQGLVPHLRPPPPRPLEDGTEPPRDPNIVYSDAPPPPFIPRRKDHAVKIINADADPFPSLNKAIMPKGGPLLLPAAQPMQQQIAISPSMMMVPQSQGALKPGQKKQQLLAPAPSTFKILPFANVNYSLAQLPTQIVSKPLLASSQIQSPPPLAKRPLPMDEARKKPGAAEPKIIKVHPKVVSKLNAVNLGGQKKFMLVKQGNDKSAKYILKAVDSTPNSGTIVIDSVVSANNNTTQAKATGNAEVMEVAQTGKTKAVTSDEMPVLSGPLHNEKREAPMIKPGPSSKKQKTEEHVALPDVAYDIGPSVLGMTPFLPSKTQSALLQSIAPSKSCYLYVVKDSAKWGIAVGTFVTFPKTALNNMMKPSVAPGILSKSPKRVLFSDHQMRNMAQTLISKGTLVTEQNLDAAVMALEEEKKEPPTLTTPIETVFIKNENGPASAIKVAAPPPLVSFKEPQKQKPPVLIAPSPAKMFPILGTLSQVPGQMTNMQPGLLLPGNGPQGSTMLMLPPGTMLPPGSILPPGVSLMPQPVSATSAIDDALVEPRQPLPSSLRIPQYLIEDLGKRLPMLLGKEGDFKVDKCNFHLVLAELSKMGYRADPKGRVVKRKTKEIPPPKPMVLPLEDGNGDLGDGKKGRVYVKRRADLMYGEITRLRRRNMYLKRQLERLRKKPLTKQKKKEITLETIKEAFTKDQYSFFLSQFNNVRRGNCGQRYEPEIYEYCSSIYLESRRVYRRLRQTFVLPDERSLLVNVPNPQYFKLPKKKQWKKKTPEELEAAKEAAAAAEAAAAISGEPPKKKKIKKKKITDSKSLAEIVKEATGETPDHVINVNVPAIPNPDFSGLVEHLLESLEHPDGSSSPGTSTAVVTLSLPQM